MNIFLIAAAAAIQPLPDYVPDDGWRDDWQANFHEEWFGRQLRAMREPPLAENRDLRGFSERFRLTILPTAYPGVTYRIDVRPNGAAFLRWTRLTGRGGYEPGKIARSGSRRLRGSEVEAIGAAWRAVDLTRLPRDDPSVNAEGNEVICIDGTAILFEHLSHQGRQFYSRGCGPMEQSLRRVAILIARLQPRAVAGWPTDLSGHSIGDASCPLSTHCGLWARRADWRHE